MYVSVSGGFSVPCMVVNSIMSQTTDAMGFYTGHFDHVTKHACVLHKYPHGFVLSDDQLSIFHDRQSISPHGFVYISSQHPGYFTFSKSDFMKRVLHTWLLGRASIFSEESPSVNKRLQTSNIHQW